ncbi:Imm52 family immunity protein [Xanthomonas translucens]|uniref:Imm52 family immunity protein n=1 Tax=Xanthomonas campestris pv. translucens TaxID=343 RepID=UPI000D3A820A|nr:Imm52 family immunity protein [Xanthomonas translucens]WLA01569.1 immunity 52 family protein [Xanthomonas translucens]WLA08433.1 immunity 52 family protein [Xanthomonas translucens]
MNVTLALKLSPEVLSPADSYSWAVGWLDRLASVHPDYKLWWSSPRGPKDSFLPFEDKGGILLRLEEAAKEFPDLMEKGAPSLLLTNAGDEKTWKKRGRITLTLNPSFGELRFRVGKIESVYEKPDSMVWSVLVALATDPRVRFAQTNVQQLVSNELLLYSVDRTPFPHREFLGWMGYVPQALKTEQVPNAARLERQGKGTLVLSTPLLDLSDPAAIKQANQVEMSLVDLDLLPVTDPNLM